MRNLSLMLFFLVLPMQTFACSWLASTEKFQHSQETSETPSKPNFIVESVYRGHKDGTNCGGFAYLNLQIDPEPKGIGFIFSIADGAIENLKFSEKAIIRIEGSSEKGEYSFNWFDGYSDRQEPIDVTLSIVAVSKNNELSEAQYLELKHPGVKLPWWKFW